MRPTKANITGIESFDHTDLARLPEYHAARQALDDLVHAVNKLTDKDGVPRGQRWWLKTVEQMAASLSYSDSSGHPRAGDTSCRHHNDYKVTWPYQAEVENGWLRGTYLCPECGTQWTCGYAVNAAEYV